jgi:hypothetical protein
MTNYINTLTLNYPVSDSDIKGMFPNTSFPSPFTPPSDYVYVFPSPRPEHDPVTQTLAETLPVLSSKGNWEQGWSIVELYETQENKDIAIAADLETKRLKSIPKEVTMRQARLALLAAGLMDDITAAIESLPSPQKEAAKIEWEYSQTVERNRGFVLLLGSALGLTSIQLDNLFIIASKL